VQFFLAVLLEIRHHFFALIFLLRFGEVLNLHPCEAFGILFGRIGREESHLEERYGHFGSSLCTASVVTWQLPFFSSAVTLPYTHGDCGGHEARGDV